MKKGNFKSKVVKVLCGLGIVATISTSMTGCGFIGDLTKSLLSDRPITATSDYTNSYNMEESNNYNNYSNNNVENNSNNNIDNIDVIGDEDTVERNDSANVNINEDTNLKTSYNHYFYNVDVGGLNAVISPTQTKYFSESSKTNNFDRRITFGEYLPVSVSLSDTDLNNFVHVVDNVNVVYKYSNLYFIDEALEEASKYNNENPVLTDLICDIDEVPSIDTLYSVISNNSKEYLRENPGLTQLSDEQLKFFVNLLHEAIIQYRPYLNDDDIRKVYSGLNDVKVACIDSSNFQVNELKREFNACVTSDFAFLFDYDNMAILRGEDVVARTMDHEINHIFQRMCPDGQIPGYDQIGGSQYFQSFEDNHRPNSVHFQWLYEASAEELVSDKYGLDPLVYTKMVGYLHSLDLVSMLSDKYDENAFELASLTTDRNSFYELFETSSEEEKMEIIKMLYTIDYLQTTREDFVEQYQKANPNGSYDYEALKYEMKPAAVATITKYFYRNLARLVNSEENVSLQDIYFLINVFETDVNSHLSYHESSNYNYNKEFIDIYVAIQDEFFKALANSSSLSYEEIVEGFSNYSGAIINNGVVSRNCGLTFLDEDEKKFLFDEILTSNLWAVSYNIRDLKEDTSLLACANIVSDNESINLGTGSISCSMSSDYGTTSTNSKPLTTTRNLLLELYYIENKRKKENKGLKFMV